MVVVVLRERLLRCVLRLLQSRPHAQKLWMGECDGRGDGGEKYLLTDGRENYHLLVLPPCQSCHYRLRAKVPLPPDNVDITIVHFDSQSECLPVEKLNRGNIPVMQSKILYSFGNGKPYQNNWISDPSEQYPLGYIKKTWKHLYVCSCQKKLMV